MPLTFEWDEEKAKTNAAKHGVRFEEAATVFADPLSLTIPDPEHSQTEDRFVLFGKSHAGKNCWLSATRKEATICASSVPDGPADANERTMKKAVSKTAEPTMWENYDFAGGVRGKYARRYARGTNLVLLDPDVAKAFPSAASVNESLRALAAMISGRKEPIKSR